MKYRTLLPILISALLATMFMASNIRSAFAASVTVQASEAKGGASISGVPVYFGPYTVNAPLVGATPYTSGEVSGSYNLTVPTYWFNGTDEHVFDHWDTGDKSQDPQTFYHSRTDTYVAGGVATHTAYYREFGPEAQSLLIHIFDSDISEYQSFQSATGAGNAIDFTDLPLSRDYIERWQTAPYNSYITERPYPSDLCSYEIDLNDQRWPLGVTTPRTFDSATNTYKHYFDATPGAIDEKAREFRIALAYLSDKDGWIRRILNGYGVRLDTKVSLPNWWGTPTGYKYNPSTAASWFDSAGFIQGSATNPYYNPSTPGSAAKLRIDPLTGTTLRTLDFYIRQDDILRTRVALELVNQMRIAGIQVNPIVTSRSVCYNQVMVIYDFDLYTAGVSLSADIGVSLWGLFHSSQYWGGTTTSYFGGVGWSPNYIGTCDAVQDGYLNMACYSQVLGDINTPGTAAYGIYQSQERFIYLEPSIPAYSRVGIQAFKTGWTGTINEKDTGPANRWSFLHAADNGTGSGTIYNPNYMGKGIAYEEPNEIDWGFDGMLSGPNPITAQSDQDLRLIGLMYDSMLAKDPYNLTRDYGFMAQSWTKLVVPPAPALPYITFTLRSGNTFHNGDPVNATDVKFSIEFTKACGPGVAWGYGTTVCIDHVDTRNENSSMTPLEVRVFFDKPSYWALHWAGYQPIYDFRIWRRAGLADGWWQRTAGDGSYYIGMVDFNQFTNRGLVRQYNPWLEYNIGNGRTDFQNDGSGPWVFDQYAPSGPISAATAVHLLPFAGYIISKSIISRYLLWSFGLVGEVNKDGAIDTVDGMIIARALGTNMFTSTWGTLFDQYNPDADIYNCNWDMITQQPIYYTCPTGPNAGKQYQGDGFVNYIEYYEWGYNYATYP